MSTTMTGIPITDCNVCGYRHPVTREHCTKCGLATLLGHETCRARKVNLMDVKRFPVVAIFNRDGSIEVAKTGLAAWHRVDMMGRPPRHGSRIVNGVDLNDAFVDVIPAGAPLDAVLFGLGIDKLK